MAPQKLYGCPVCGTDTVYLCEPGRDDLFRAVASWTAEGEPDEMYPPEQEVLPAPNGRFMCGGGHSFSRPVPITEPER